MSGYRPKLQVMDSSGILTLRRLEEVAPLAQALVTIFPEPERALLGVYELLLNALEHGNLEIGFGTKGKLKERQQWEEEIRRRQDMPEYCRREVTVEYIKQPDMVSLVIRDDGRGFDWQTYLTLVPERAHLQHGRGIALARMVSFDEMTYQGCGNEVTCLIRTGVKPISQ